MTVAQKPHGIVLPKVVFCEGSSCYSQKDIVAGRWAERQQDETARFVKLVFQRYFSLHGSMINVSRIYS